MPPRVAAARASACVAAGPTDRAPDLRETFRETFRAPLIHPFYPSPPHERRDDEPGSALGRRILVRFGFGRVRGCKEEIDPRGDEFNDHNLR